MGLINWFMGLFDSDGILSVDGYCGTITDEAFYRELAVQACINMIANTVACSEFLTFEKGVEVRSENYYLLNVQPNQNKSASKFWRDVIGKLIYDNHCLIIQQGGMFYMADSYDVDEYAFKENVYKNIVVSKYALTGIYFESQVFHFELHNKEMKNIIAGVNLAHSKLVSSAATSYKRSKAKRGSLEIPTNYTQTEKGQSDLNDLLDNRFKRFFEAEGGAVLPLTSGMKYNELMSSTGSEGNPIRSLINDVFDFTAIGFQIPPQLIKGDVVDTDKAVNNYLTFCIPPIAEIITDEINRKYYGKKLYLERTYMKLDTSRIKVVDIKDIASSLDILTRIGAYCVDDSLMALGKEPLNTEWSKARFMTKNYENIEDRLKGTATPK